MVGLGCLDESDHRGEWKDLPDELFLRRACCACDTRERRPVRRQARLQKQSRKELLTVRFLWLRAQGQHQATSNFSPSPSMRESACESTLPPESTMPTRLQSFGIFFVKTAAAAAVPDGSTSNFIRNSMKRMVCIMSSSLTVNTASAFARVTGKVSAPGVWTRKPSAIVGGGGIFTRSPLRIDCSVSFAVSGSTAKHLIDGLIDFTAVLTPA